METIKSFSDLQQSKKLAEILPLESADYHYIAQGEKSYFYPYSLSSDAVKHYDEEIKYIPCWSLAALLEILDYPQLSKDKLGSGKEGWMVSAYPNDCRYDSCWHDNPIDACYELILKLNEIKRL